MSNSTSGSSMNFNEKVEFCRNWCNFTTNEENFVNV